MKNDKHTYIQIKKVTRTRLKDMQLFNRESYDYTINRLLNSKTKIVVWQETRNRKSLRKLTGKCLGCKQTGEIRQEEHKETDGTRIKYYRCKTCGFMWEDNKMDQQKKKGTEELTDEEVKKVADRWIESMH